MPTGNESTEPYKRITYSGYSSIDTLSIGTIKIPNVEFLEWDILKNTSVQIWDFVYDGVISLSLPGRGASSLLKLLEDTSNLDAKMISLDLSRSHATSGNLVIGVKDQLMDHPNTVKLPIVEHPNTTFSGLWTTSIKSYTVKSRNIQFPTYSHAVLDPGTFQTILPRGYGLPLLALLGAYRYLWINYIDCARVATLPDLVFTFKEGQTVKLTSEDYVVRMDFDGFDFTLCTIAFDDAKYFPEIPDDTMIMGSSFLRRFHSIWDWENKIIGL
jgi:hypothetical protein